MVQIPIIWFLNIWWYALSLLSSIFIIFLHFPPSHTKFHYIPFLYCLIVPSTHLWGYIETAMIKKIGQKKRKKLSSSWNEGKKKEKKVVKLKWPSRWKLRSRMTFCWFLNVLSLYISPVYIYSPASISFPFHFISFLPFTPQNDDDNRKLMLCISLNV